MTSNYERCLFFTQCNEITKEEFKIFATFILKNVYTNLSNYTLTLYT